MCAIVALRRLWVNEHVLHGSPKLLIHLHLLFNAFTQHSHICHDFLVGQIRPIIKDISGDISSVDNYRGLTLSSVFSQLFEHCLFLKFGHLFLSDDL